MRTEESRGKGRREERALLEIGELSSTEDSCSNRSEAQSPKRPKTSLLYCTGVVDTVELYSEASNEPSLQTCLGLRWNRRSLLSCVDERVDCRLSFYCVSRAGVSSAPFGMTVTEFEERLSEDDASKKTKEVPAFGLHSRAFCKLMGL